MDCIVWTWKGIVCEEKAWPALKLKGDTDDEETGSFELWVPKIYTTPDRAA
jgi:hypothetical protein